MYSPPIPQIPQIPASDATFEFTANELIVVKECLPSYNNGDKRERYLLLANKILPRLFRLNGHLPGDAWKFRKGVSTQ